jgi:hypothetical protein
MKKYLFAFGLSLMASSSFAISNAKLAQVCLNKGSEKVISQAQAWGCQVGADQIEVQAIDNRWYNPSKYIWYQAVVPCNGFDRVIRLVQHYKGKCF